MFLRTFHSTRYFLLNRFRSRNYLNFPYFIACNELSQEYNYALSILEKKFENLTFPVDRFYWYASNSLIAANQNRNNDAIEFAKQALEAAQVKKSGFRYHQNIGLVGKEHQKVIKKLVKLVG